MKRQEVLMKSLFVVWLVQERLHVIHNSTASTVPMAKSSRLKSNETP
jgi:hypothetical protein